MEGNGRYVETPGGRYVDIPVEAGPDTLIVKEGTTFNKTYVINAGNGVSMPANHIIVEKDAFTDICIIITPGVDADIPITVDMIGEGSDFSLSGIYICGSSERVSLETVVRHRVPGCKSNQHFNGIVSGTARTDFFGRIIVAPNAQKTEAYQVNRNILLSDKAKVNTKPQLEIYADDVKCSHGATIGRLDEEAQFYMRSRGIPLEEAKVLQMLSFISPVLNHIHNPEDRKSVAGDIDEAIRKIL
jgi:Fe-S cluster assembly protein SufD